jgi:hypothetical protein
MIYPACKSDKHDICPKQYAGLEPKGKARIWLVTEYGMETAKLLTCLCECHS